MSQKVQKVIFLQQLALAGDIKVPLTYGHLQFAIPFVY